MATCRFELEDDATDGETLSHRRALPGGCEANTAPTCAMFNEPVCAYVCYALSRMGLLMLGQGD
jgi:hypothetical protein